MTTAERSDAMKRVAASRDSMTVLVNCRHWVRPYVFLVDGDTATPVDFPNYPYDTETLKANAYKWDVQEEARR